MVVSNKFDSLNDELRLIGETLEMLKGVQIQCEPQYTRHTVSVLAVLKNMVETLAEKYDNLMDEVKVMEDREHDLYGEVRADNQ